jgi:hypothetical protein
MSDLLTSLAELPEGAVVYEPAMCAYLQRTPWTLRRAVARGELPAPFRLLGKRAWTAGAVVRYLEQRQADAVQRQAETGRRILAMRP